ncbi:uncharacterized protein METZ01_LOCUS290120, partial [marine metagenome]
TVYVSPGSPVTNPGPEGPLITCPQSFIPLRLQEQLVA